MAASAGSSKKLKANAPEDDEGPLPFDAQAVLARALALCDSPEARPPAKP